MSRVDVSQRVPTEYSKPLIVDVLTAITTQLNGISEGRMAARHNAQSTIPTTTAATSYAVGDFVPDSNCTVRSSVAPGLAAAYVRLGWVCVSPSPSPTFVEARVLTGT